MYACMHVFMTIRLHVLKSVSVSVPRYVCISAWLRVSSARRLRNDRHRGAQHPREWLSHKWHLGKARPPVTPTPCPPQTTASLWNYHKRPWPQAHARDVGAGHLAGDTVQAKHTDRARRRRRRRRRRCRHIVTITRHRKHYPTSPSNIIFSFTFIHYHPSRSCTHV